MKSASTLAATAAIVVLALASTPTHVEAHGGMINPKPRAITTMKLAIDSTFGHPIPMRGDYTNGKGGDCINFTPDSNLQSIPVGTSKISMRANDGANHVGPCTVYLVDPQDKSKKLQVGQMKDCMRSLHPGPGAKGDKPIMAEMTIDVPSSGLPCKPEHCVLRFDWEAQHITPSEFYNNCADVKIGGASSGGDDTPASTPKPVTTTKPATTKPTTTKPAATEPATTTKPSTPPVTAKPNATEPAVTKKPSTPAATSKPIATKEPATPEPVSKTPTTKKPSTPSSGCKAKKKYVGTTPDMTQWCNWNCPKYCPEDLCKEA